MSKKLGEIIKERRKQRGLTPAKLGRMAGIYLSEIYRIEQGKRFPRAPTLRKLAKPLGFTEVELFKLAGYLSDDEGEIKVFKLAGYL